MRTIHRDIVGAFIFDKNGRLLLGQSTEGGVYQNLWVVPGGGIDTHETLVEALIREVSEELTLDISSAKIKELEGVATGTSHKVLKETGEKVIVDMSFHDFKVTIPESASKIIFKCDDDFTAAMWFDPEKLKDLNIGPAIKSRLESMDII